MPTITRKIQVFINEDDKKKRNELYQKWRSFNRACFRAANMVSSHAYIQRYIADLFYYTEDVKVKLANVSKDPAGVLTMSRDNTTYQLLSKYFKGEAPMGMMSGLNMVVNKNIKAEEKDVSQGRRSLRTYRDTIPMPIRSADISKVIKEDNGNYSFFVYGTPFKTNFGKDLSGNESIFDRAVSGDYKLCDSSIVFKGNKMFLLAVFSFESDDVKIVDPCKVANCELSVQHPIIVKFEKREWKIGGAEEYLHRRIAIQGARTRLQKALRYAGGGKGRKAKLAALERYSEQEKNYVKTCMHNYSRRLIDYCLKNKIGTINLVNIKDVKIESEGDKLLLPNWSYGSLLEKILYKAAVHGIIVKGHKDVKEEIELA